MNGENNIQAPATSRAIVVFTGISGLLILAVATGLFELIGTAAVAGVLFTIAGTLDASARPVRNIIASVIFVLGVCAIGAAISLALITAQDGANFILSGEQFFSIVFIVAVGAVTYSLTILSTGASISQTTRLLCVNGGSLVVVPVSIFLLLLIVFQTVAGPLPGFQMVLTGLIAPDSPVLGLVSIFGLFAVAAGSLGQAVKRFPVRLVTTEFSQSVLQTRLNRLKDWLLRLSIGAFVVGAMAFLLLPPLWESVVATLPSSVVTSLVVVATAQSLRFVLLGVTGLAIFFVLSVGLLSRIRSESIQHFQRLLAYGTVVLVAVGAAFLISADRIVDLIVTTETSDTIIELHSTIGSLPFLVGLFIVATIIPTTLFVVGAVFGLFGILIPRTAAPVVAACGLITAVIAGSRLGSFTVAHVLVVALAFVVWGVGTYGYQLNFELGHGGSRVELVHTGAVAAVTLVGLILFYVVREVTEYIALEGTLTTAIITLVGLVMIFAVVRV
jgi:hypothetical protein